MRHSDTIQGWAGDSAKKGGASLVYHLICE